MTVVTIGLAATKAPWSAAFRSYVRDHGQGMVVHVILDRAGLEQTGAGLDVLLVDDLMRTFSVLDVARAQDRARVVGLFDPGVGMGAQYVTGLGVDHVVAASTPPAELAGLILQIGPRQPVAAAINLRPAWAGAPTGAPGSARRGTLSAWTKVSGGSGLTEAVVAAAEILSRRERVLVIEAEELSPILVSRLLRSADSGLAWALSRASQGLRALPEALSGPHDDGVLPIGHFDVVCAAPGVQALNSAHLSRLLAEALSVYDHVMVETGWLVGPTSGRDRFATVREVLLGADGVVVLASADPEGAGRLVEWRAAAVATGVEAPCTAAFGRCRDSRFERDQLASTVMANTGAQPFSGINFLPEDRTVARARWNAELVWRGPWLKAVSRLVPQVTGSAGRKDKGTPRAEPGAGSWRTGPEAIAI